MAGTVRTGHAWTRAWTFLLCNEWCAAGSQSPSTSVDRVAIFMMLLAILSHRWKKMRFSFYHLLQDSGLIKEEPERRQEPNQRMEFCVAVSSALKHRLQGRREAYNTPAKAGKTQKGQEINTTYKAQKAAGASRITRSLSRVTVWVTFLLLWKKTPRPKRLSGRKCSILSFQSEG